MKVRVIIQGDTIMPYSQADGEAIKSLNNAVYEVSINNFDLRTAQQNRAMHKYFELVATALSDSGQDVKTVIKADAPWTAERIKELMWRPIMKVLTGKDSTTKLTKAEIDKVYDVMNRALGERCCVHVPFPSSKG